LFPDQLHGGGQQIDEDSTSSTGDSELLCQIGSGGSKQDPSFIEKVASLVSKKLQPSMASNEWQNYNLNPPNVSTLATPNTLPQLKFENVLQNQKNDKFDQKRLLKFVPTQFKEKARQLLDKISENPEQLDFSTDGIIYIDKTSIPNSDVFHLFPYLFKTRRPQNLEGFADLLNQIQHLGLSHLIKNTKPQTLTNSLSLTTNIAQEKTNWWYLGP
jgi:hypothetical protein